MALLKRLFLLLALCVGAVAQEPKPASPAQTPPPQQQQKPKAPELGVEVENAPEKTITPAQAQELFRAVDQILRFDSEQTGLPIKRRVKRALTDRDEVQRFLEDRMKKDRDTQRLERSAVVLEKFGLLPRGFDLQKFLVELLREQVAGYYDEHTKTVYMLNWIDAAGQKPVLAHELTHALQDQSFALKKWLKEPDSNNLQRQIDDDEQTAARQAVVEGQAMVTLMDFYLAPTGQSVVSSPQLVEAMRVGMNASDQGSPVFGRAPMFLKEALTFPYNYGLNFERELLVKGGKQLAFNEVFRKPPRTTREIMEPQTYLAGEKMPPLLAPNFDKLLDDYRRFDVGAIGEFDVAILMEQYGARQARRTLPSAWRGGYYYAARRKKGDIQPLALVFVTRWASPEAARQFAGIYADFLPRRYKTATKNGADGAWNTNEGTVSIETRGNTLLVLESLDAATAAKVREAVFGAAMGD